jgi:serine/threonine-protein kinase RIO1
MKDATHDLHSNVVNREYWIYLRLTFLRDAKALSGNRNHRDARRGALCRLMADRLNLFARASIATMLGRPSTEKEASVTVASPRSAASLAVEIVMSSAVSDKRSEVAALRATTSSAARTRTLAVSFTLTAYSGMGQALA